MIFLCNADDLEELEDFLNVNRSIRYFYLTLNSLFLLGVECALQSHFPTYLKRSKSLFIK